MASWYNICTLSALNTSHTNILVTKQLARAASKIVITSSIQSTKNRIKKDAVHNHLDNLELRFEAKLIFRGKEISTCKKYVEI